jgi:hypothetical protein
VGRRRPQTCGRAGGSRRSSRWRTRRVRQPTRLLDEMTVLQFNPQIQAEVGGRVVCRRRIHYPVVKGFQPAPARLPDSNSSSSRNSPCLFTRRANFAGSKSASISVADSPRQRQHNAGVCASGAYRLQHFWNHCTTRALQQLVVVEFSRNEYQRSDP